MPLFTRPIALLSTAFLFASVAWADCECGYTVNGTLYTELLETDFLHTNQLNETGWMTQVYSVESDAARGPFGKAAEAKQVAPNPLKSRYDWAGDGIDGGDAGLQLIVSNPGKSGMIPMGEMATNRSDMRYGSFRAAIQLTGQKGTCGAFFWYLNNSHEIDMEFLSSQFNESSHPVNLVLQSEESVKAGYDAGNTNDFDTYQLPFDPSEGFNEYRFDWFEDRVEFYANGVFLKSMSGEGVPKDPGHLMLSQWSNGDPKWSGGPPKQDAVMTVSYVKGYFNSSDTQRQGDWKKRCKDINAPNATCEVPEITGPPQTNTTAKTFFFSQQQNMTVNQTVSGGNPNTIESGAWSIHASTQSILTFMLLSALVLVMNWCS
ncbi:MAG: hypothetical protein LQ349_001642 [Xanthoria aureola]|nr:MAG: hypothetical protein LQ349_001642 [Xanthoria aureola]